MKSNEKFIFTDACNSLPPASLEAPSFAAALLQRVQISCYFAGCNLSSDPGQEKPHSQNDPAECTECKVLAFSQKRKKKERILPLKNADAACF